MKYYGDKVKMDKMGRENSMDLYYGDVKFASRSPGLEPFATVSVELSVHTGKSPPSLCSTSTSSLDACYMTRLSHPP
jgi:hypothetical protein